MPMHSDLQAQSHKSNGSTTSRRLGIVVGGVLLFGLGFVVPQGLQSLIADNDRSMISADSCAPVSQEAAGTLLTRIFPKSKVLSAEELFSDSSRSGCIVEVDMLTDRERPETRGYVYVLPDGEHILNGPLMDKRSQIAMIGELPPPLEQALTQRANALAGAGVAPSDLLAGTPLANTEVVPAGTGPVARSLPIADAAAEVANQSTLLRQAFLTKVKALPSLTTQQDGRDVYVLLDPECIHCRDLYANQQRIAATHNVRFHWVPIFTSERGWGMAALLAKTAKTDKARALELLDLMMKKKWKPEDNLDESKSITSEDLEFIKPNTLAYVDARKTEPTLGTPVVMFETASGSIEIINGVPKEADWSELGMPIF